MLEIRETRLWGKWQKVIAGDQARLGAGGNAEAPQWAILSTATRQTARGRDLGRLLPVFGPVPEMLVYSAIWAPSRRSWLIEEAIQSGFLAAALEDLAPVLWFVHRRCLQMNLGPVRRREAINHLVHESYNIVTNHVRVWIRSGKPHTVYRRKKRTRTSKMENS